MNNIVTNMHILPPEINNTIPVINHIITDDDLVSYNKKLYKILRQIHKLMFINIYLIYHCDLNIVL